MREREGGGDEERKREDAVFGVRKRCPECGKGWGKKMREGEIKAGRISTAMCSSESRLRKESQVLLLRGSRRGKSIIPIQLFSHVGNFGIEGKSCTCRSRDSEKGGNYLCV